LVDQNSTISSKIHHSIILLKEVNCEQAFAAVEALDQIPAFLMLAPLVYCSTTSKEGARMINSSK
jgi:hypothetical protein